MVAVLAALTGWVADTVRLAWAWIAQPVHLAAILLVALIIVIAAHAVARKEA